jgi:hypothetical protein
MRTGDTVVLAEDPLRHGYGTLESVLRDGRVTVRWEGGDIRPYHPQALLPAQEWEASDTGTFTNADLQRLAQS